MRNLGVGRQVQLFRFLLYIFFPLSFLQVLSKRLETIKENHWIGRQTRAVFVEFSIYNSHINRFAIVRLTFEFRYTGGVDPFDEFQ